METGLSSLVIAVAPNGARRTRRDHPALPIEPAELADCAVSCADAGASLFHLHVRDKEGKHSLDSNHYRAAIDAIRAAAGQRLVIQVTTESAGMYGPAEQMRLVRDLQPEAVSLALRELVPDVAAESAAAEFLAWTCEAGIMPQYILYSAGDVRRWHALRAAGVIPGEEASVLFVLGRHAAPGEDVGPLAMLPFLAEHDPGTPWSLCAFGPREHACCTAAAALGGHVRVGFENNLHLRDGTIAPDNAALVAQMAEAAHALGRPPATGDDVRAMFAAAQQIPTGSAE